MNCTNITTRFDVGEAHSTEYKNLTTAERCFDLERSYSRGTRWHAWVEFVADLLASRSVHIITLVNFFSIIEHFSFQRSVVPHSFCVAFPEASTPFSTRRISISQSWWVQSQYYLFLVLNMTICSDLVARCLLDQTFKAGLWQLISNKWLVRN